jgi:hypothetical protein
MMQWVPTANGTVQDEKELFRAFSDVFPHATMWWQLYGGCALLVGTRQPFQLDYGKLKAHFDEGRVRQDMALSQIRDVDHLLSFFVFDEKAFADFVKDARPTSDDHTVLDFTMPRYVGSGFGLGQFNMKVFGTGGSNPFQLTSERRTMYLAQRRSIVPYLTNLGGESPQAIATRIEQRRDLPFVHRIFQEAEWKQMRADGTIPALSGVVAATRP